MERNEWKRHLQKGLERLGREMNVSFTVTETLEETGATYTLKAVPYDPLSGPDAEEFRQRAPRLGLEVSDLGKTFSDKGYLFRIVGCRTGLRRPIVCQRKDGPLFLYSARIAARHLGKELKPIKVPKTTPGTERNIVEIRKITIQLGKALSHELRETLERKRDLLIKKIGRPLTEKDLEGLTKVS